MNFIILGVIIQALITLFILFNLWNRENKVINLLLLYIVIVCLDFIYEYFMINKFTNESILYEIPGSLRLFKGLIFLKITSEFTGINVNRWIRYLAILFSVIFIHNLFCVVIETSGIEKLHIVLEIYQSYIQYYIYYWIAILSFCIYKLYQSRLAETDNNFTKSFKYFLIFILANVTIFFTLYKLDYDLSYFNRIYTLLFLVQFAWIIMIYLKAYKQMNQFKSQETIADSKEKYSAQKKEESELERIAGKIEEYYKKNDTYLSENFSLDILAKELNESKSVISMTFSQYLESNFHSYTNQFRIEHCLKKMKDNPKINISDLTYECGFKSKATFYKYFKLKFNCTPVEYLHTLDLKT